MPEDYLKCVSEKDNAKLSEIRKTKFNVLTCNNACPEVNMQKVPCNKFLFLHGKMRITGWEINLLPWGMTTSQCWQAICQQACKLASVTEFSPCPELFSKCNLSTCQMPIAISSQLLKNSFLSCGRHLVGFWVDVVVLRDAHFIIKLFLI